MGPTYESGTAALFDGGGRLVGRLGRLGSGPGEMKGVMSVAGWPGDTVAVVHDWGLISLFDGRGQHARTLEPNSQGYQFNTVTPAPGGALLVRRFGTMGGDDVPLREYSMAGEPLHGYGPSTHFGDDRIYAGVAAAGDTLWAIDHFSYEIDVFQRGDGAVRETIRRAVEWFPEGRVLNEWGGHAEVLSFTRYEPGRMLVLLSRPCADYTPPPRMGPMREHAPAAPRQPDHTGMAEKHEQVLELLDLDTRRVLARLEVDGPWLGGFIDEDEVYGYEERSGSGEVVMSVWRVEVAGLPSNGTR